MKWISVKDRLPENSETKYLIYIPRDYYYPLLTVAYYSVRKHCWIGVECGTYYYDQPTHYMSLPAPPTEQNKLTLVDNNKMLWVGKEHFRCSCGGNVFSEYKDSDGKRVFECHSCRSKYEGE